MPHQHLPHAKNRFHPYLFGWVAELKGMGALFDRVPDLLGRDWGSAGAVFCTKPIDSVGEGDIGDRLWMP